MKSFPMKVLFLLLWGSLLASALPKNERESMQNFRKIALSLDDFARAYPELKIHATPRQRWQLTGTPASASGRGYRKKHPAEVGYRYDSCLAYRDELKTPDVYLSFKHYPYESWQVAREDFPSIASRALGVERRTRTFRADRSYWEYQDLGDLPIGDQRRGGSAWGFRMRGGRLVLNLLVRQGADIYDITFHGLDRDARPALQAIRDWLKRVSRQAPAGS